MSNGAQNFVMVGERTNVTGSAKFRKLVEANDYAAALEVARQQVENGANMLDVNMDEGMLNSEQALVTLLNILSAWPEWGWPSTRKARPSRPSENSRFASALTAS